jgi:hypothetical protein
MSGKPATIKTEPVVGSIKLKNAHAKFTLLTPQGKPMAAADVANGTIPLDGKTPTHWILVTRD